LLIKKTLDEWLDSVSYGTLNSSSYVPTEFALTFMNFIKLVNGKDGEQNKTPPVHLAMLDKIVSPVQRVANLCFRGSGKTTLFGEYFFPYLGVFGYLPNFGRVPAAIYVSDSMDNGVKSLRKNMEFRYKNSEFLQEWIPKATFTDNYIEFQNREGALFGLKMFGAKALSLDSSVYTVDGISSIGACQPGDRIFGPDGQLTTITAKSEVFYKPMYRIRLHDGRELKVSEDHLNVVTQLRQHTTGTLKGRMYFEDRVLTVPEILEYNLKNGSNYRFWIKATEPLAYPERDLPLDPYTLGLLLGDGRIKANGNSDLIAHESDWPTYERHIPYQLGKVQRDNRRPTTITRSVRGLQSKCIALGINCHGRSKEVPAAYLRGSINQRLALLQGLLDTDGTITTNGYVSFCSQSENLALGVLTLVRSLGGLAVLQPRNGHFKVGIKINLPVFRLARKLERQRFDRRTMARIEAIEPIELEPSQCIAVDNADRQFLTDGYTRTHNTGLRGTKIFGKRPPIAVLDDLVSDDDSKSRAAMMAIKDTVYKGIDYALDPTRRKIIFNGTPFNSEDILIEAVESGAWDVNVWPVCETFPCSREEFQGAWEDRFTYDFVKKQYDDAVLTGKVAAFQQELMLRITSEEERLVQDAEIRWYKRQALLNAKGSFNFYITTDFATSAKQTADFSVISVWAYNANGDWFWVDGICERQTMDKSIDDLFRLVQEYKPQQVGIEVTGQQGAFINWLQNEMITRNVWFNFASSEKSNAPGIRPVVDKLSRFNIVVPWFKAGKIYWPEEMKQSQIMGQFMNQIRLVTQSGIKGKDDCIDTISMLGYLKPWKPSESMPVTKQEIDVFEEEYADINVGGLSTYIV
jgi:predicted phage terminase large subunit-like protein